MSVEVLVQSIHLALFMSALMIYSKPAYAQVNPWTETTLSIEERDFDGLSRSISIGGEYYPTDLPSIEENSIPTLDYELRYRRKGQLFEVGAQFIGQARQYEGAQADLVFNFSELYVGEVRRGRYDESRILFGRKIYDWNKVDDYWDLGIWQARSRWSHLNPETIGLFGAFGESRGRVLDLDSTFVAFATPLSVPEHVPPFEIVDGRVVSKDPYFQDVPSQAELLTPGEFTEIYYEVNTPPIEDIVFRPGGGFLWRLGDQKGPWAQAAYAYKPSTKTLFGFDGNLNVDQLTAELIPKVYYQHLTSLEFGYRDSAQAYTLSATVNDPEDVSFDPDITHQDVSRSEIVGLSARWALDLPLMNQIQFRADYLRTFGGGAEDRGPFVSRSGSYFQPKLRYREAVGFAFKKDIFRAGAQSLDLESRLIYETFTETNAVIAKANWGFSRDLSLVFQAEVITASQEVESFEPGQPNFLYENRANDRFSLGINYVF
jgi:hypothetical protein